MILKNIKDIKKLRKRMGITQKELSKISGVSQSLIAKIESGIVEPSYSKAMKLVDALENYSSNEKKACDIMTKKIIFCKPNDRVSDAVKMMQKYKISQMPVLDNNKCIGLISESSILKAKLRGEASFVRECLEPCPPIISEKSTLRMISSLLEFSPIVLVVKQGKFVGVITKTDVINGLNRE